MGVLSKAIVHASGAWIHARGRPSALPRACIDLIDSIAAERHLIDSAQGRPDFVVSGSAANCVGESLLAIGEGHAICSGKWRTWRDADEERLPGFLEF